MNDGTKKARQAKPAYISRAPISSDEHDSCLAYKPRVRRIIFLLHPRTVSTTSRRASISRSTTEAKPEAPYNTFIVISVATVTATSVAGREAQLPPCKRNTAQSKAPSQEHLPTRKHSRPLDRSQAPSHISLHPQKTAVAVGQTNAGSPEFLWSELTLAALEFPANRVAVAPE